jgi:hypothetical protein
VFKRSSKDKVFFKEKAKFRGCNSYKKDWKGFPFYYAYLHIVISLCTKFHQNPPNGLGRVAKTQYFLEKDKFRDHNSFKNNWARFPLIYAHLQSVIFLCTQFPQNPLKRD